MVHASPWQPRHAQVDLQHRRDCAENTNPEDTRSITISTPEQQHIDGHELETAFWRNQKLSGRQVAPLDVLMGYRQFDTTSLRSGFFLQKLCLQQRMLMDQPVLPDQVITEFGRVRGNNNKCQLAIAHFKSICCLNGLPLQDRYISPEEVTGEFNAINALLELARFMEKCYLLGLPLHGRLLTMNSVEVAFKRANACTELNFFHQRRQQRASFNRAMASTEQICAAKKGQRLVDPKMTPEELVENYYAMGDLVRLGCFLKQCCLENIFLHGQPVHPETVFKNLHNANAPRELARFLEQLCLRESTLFGQPVTPELVINEFEALGLALELGRFGALCCLHGLLPNGRRISTETVENYFRTAMAPLELAHFKAQCCLTGLLLHGQPVSAEGVVKGYLSIEAFEECARFYQQCCLKGIALDDRPVTPDMVVTAYLKTKAPLGLARFMEHCCLNKLHLFGKPVPPEMVISNFPASPIGRLSATRFKEHCCLKGLSINGTIVTAEELANDYQRAGWKQEKAVFYAQLVLHARKLHGQYVDSHQVMQAFADAPGRHMKKKMHYLMRRLNTFPELDDTGEVLTTFELACQVINKINRNDGPFGHQQCILHFLAMHYGLSIDARPVTPEQVWQLMTQLRSSYRTIRLKFFFLAHCCKVSLPLHGKLVARQQVMDCLLELPEEIRLRHALTRWFESFYDLPGATRVADGQVLRQQGSDSKRGNDLQGAATSPLLRGSCLPTPQPTLLTIAVVSPVVRKVLSIIQDINDRPGDPPLQITGSFSRYLQGVCSSYQDIDIIGTPSQVQVLLTQLTNEITQADGDVPTGVYARPTPGCPQLRLPATINMALTEGDLHSKTLLLQASTYEHTELSHHELLPVQPCTLNKPVTCLSFLEEVRLMSKSVNYLIDHLDTLTATLQGDHYFPVPRTILFNCPQNPDERVCGLLMRALLTLDKARQFCLLLHNELSSEQKSWVNRQHQRCQTELITLAGYVRQLQAKLHGHPCYRRFTSTVNHWLASSSQNSIYDIKRHVFVQNLLKTLVTEPFNPGAVLRPTDSILPTDVKAANRYCSGTEPINPGQTADF